MLKSRPIQEFDTVVFAFAEEHGNRLARGCSRCGNCVHDWQTCVLQDRLTGFFCYACMQIHQALVNGTDIKFYLFSRATHRTAEAMSVGIGITISSIYDLSTCGRLFMPARVV